MAFTASEWIGLTAIFSTGVLFFVGQWIVVARRTNDKIAALDVRRDEDRDELRKDLEGKIEKARQLAHDYANRVHVTNAEIHNEINLVRAEYLRRDEFNAHISRLQNGVDLVRSDLTTMNGRMDRILAIMSAGNKRARPATEE